jgi:hypothetical protein
VIGPEPTQETNLPSAVEAVVDEPTAVGFTAITALPESYATEPEASAADEILSKPSQLRQAAASVVVPTQTKSQPWNSNTLFAGLIGLAVFALIAGLVVARRGVPGAIAS